MTDQSARQQRTLPSRSEPSPSGLVEHFFRRESGRLVSVLIRLFGLRHLDLVEDMVQATLVEALQVWRVRGVPDEPSAWMHRVARNKVVDALRRARLCSGSPPHGRDCILGRPRPSSTTCSSTPGSRTASSGCSSRVAIPN